MCGIKIVIKLKKENYSFREFTKKSISLHYMYRSHIEAMRSKDINAEATALTNRTKMLEKNEVLNKIGSRP